MCPECHRIICEEGCPAYSGRSPEWGNILFTCRRCHTPVGEEEPFYSIGPRPYCRDCLTEVTLEELLPLFGIADREELLLMLGALPRHAREEEVI